jgi:hypothetical protein
VCAAFFVFVFVFCSAGCLGLSLELGRLFFFPFVPDFASLPPFFRDDRCSGIARQNLLQPTSLNAFFAKFFGKLYSGKTK